ncbi:MAG: hypothetical protein JJ975_09335 [Bacteroidia bacterium]|nr:hypothetical protein [Bacteroidia bacterium]
MVRKLITLVLCLVAITAKAQQFGVNTNLLLSYSGLSQALRASYQHGPIQLYLGTKYNLSKSVYPWSGKLGLSTAATYVLSEDKVAGKVFAAYELLPLPGSRVNEFYIGYGIRYNATNKFSVSGCAGFGGYRERATGTHPFTLNGIGYCTSIGISYGFW